MPRSFSYFDLIAYIASGFPIIIAADMLVPIFQWFQSYSAEAQLGPVVSSFLILILALTVGSANSTIAHWFFQEGGFSMLFGKPSAHLMNEVNEGGKKQSPKGKGILSRFSLFKYCDRLEKEIIESIKTRAQKEAIGNKALDHKVVWALAHRRARYDANFVAANYELLTMFHFARNMHTSLVASAIILALFAALKYSEGEAITNIVLTIVIILVIAALLFVRFLYSFGGYAKQVLKEYAVTSPETQGAKIDKPVMESEFFRLISMQLTTARVEDER